jgi:sortase (surface protein transpeptidase)
VKRVVIALTTLVAVALGGGCSTTGSSARADGKIASPAPSRATTSTSSSTSTSTSWPEPDNVPQYHPKKPVLDSSDPVRLDIPAIGVSTTLVRLGLAADGTMEVPKKWAEAGWYTGGPRPGENGPAVIAGHVDSTSGPAVFYRLRDLRAGDKVLVTRADHSVVQFVINRLQAFPKTAFPTATVFAPTPVPALRLITCTGAFDRRARSYLENLVAFASPVS